MMLGASGCAKLNAEYGETEGSTGDPATSKGSTRGTVSSTSVGPSTSGSGATTADSGTSVGDDTTTSVDPSGQPTTIGESGDHFDVGRPVCVVVPETVCDAYGGECGKAESCRPYDPDGNGEVLDTYCFADGEASLGAACKPACAEELKLTCEAGSACDLFSSVPAENGACRPLCTGTVTGPGCVDGLCFQYEAFSGDGFGLCRGDCNPTAKGSECMPEQTCVVREDAPTPTCLPNAAVGVNGDCSDSECPEGSICMSGANLAGCDGWCCAQICDPPDDVCPEEGICVPLEDIGGPVVDMGYCNPP